MPSRFKSVNVKSSKPRRPARPKTPPAPPAPSPGEVWEIRQCDQIEGCLVTERGNVNRPIAGALAQGPAAGREEELLELREAAQTIAQDPAYAEKCPELHMVEDLRGHCRLDSPDRLPQQFYAEFLRHPDLVDCFPFCRWRIAEMLLSLPPGTGGYDVLESILSAMVKTLDREFEASADANTERHRLMRLQFRQMLAARVPGELGEQPVRAVGRLAEWWRAPGVTLKVTNQDSPIADDAWRVEAVLERLEHCVVIGTVAIVVMAGRPGESLAERIAAQPALLDTLSETELANVLDCRRFGRGGSEPTPAKARDASVHCARTEPTPPHMVLGRTEMLSSQIAPPSQGPAPAQTDSHLDTCIKMPEKPPVSLPQEFEAQIAALHDRVMALVEALELPHTNDASEILLMPDMSLRRMVSVNIGGDKLVNVLCPALSRSDRRVADAGPRITTARKELKDDDQATEAPRAN